MPTSVAGGAGSDRRPHERAQILWGQYLEVRRRDPHRRDAAGSRSAATTVAAQRDGAERGRAARRPSSQLAEAVRSNAGAGSADMLERAEGDGVEAVDQHRSRPCGSTTRECSFAAGQPSGGAEALRGVDAGGPNFALAFSALAQTYSTLGYDDEAAQYSRRAMSMSDRCRRRKST